MASKKNAEAISEGRVKLHLVTPGAALPVDEATFDKACTVATMYVIEDPAAVFTEMYRVLTTRETPDAETVAQTPGRVDYPWPWRTM